MKTIRTTILILSIPFLVLAIVADTVDQDGLVPKFPQLSTSQDNLSFQSDKQQSPPGIHDCSSSSETASPVSSAFTDSGQSVPRLSLTLSFSSRAPPLS